MKFEKPEINAVDRARIVAYFILLFIPLEVLQTVHCY